MKRTLSVIIYLCLSYAWTGAEDRFSYIYALPAADNTGYKEPYIRSLHGDSITFIPVPTPVYPIDLGQSACQKLLDETLKETNKKGIMHTGCGGTATVINYLTYGEKEDLIEAVILEGPIASINVAVKHRTSHTLTHPIFKNETIDRWVYELSSTAVGKYFFPHVMIFCGYVAWKKQPLEMVPFIKHKDLRIVIVMQYPNDHAVHYTQAQALYYAFRKHGYDNVFIMPHQNETHTDLLSPETEQVAAIKRIVQGDIRDEDRQQYQPDFDQFEPIYTAIMKRDKEVRLGL